MLLRLQAVRQESVKIHFTHPCLKRTARPEKLPRTTLKDFRSRMTKKPLFNPLKKNLSETPVSSHTRVGSFFVSPPAPLFAAGGFPLPCELFPLSRKLGRGAIPGGGGALGVAAATVGSGGAAVLPGDGEFIRFSPAGEYTKPEKTKVVVSVGRQEHVRATQPVRFGDRFRCFAGDGKGCEQAHR
jgi:hypothetical protein